MATRYPELVPGLPSLASLAQTSKHVSTLTSTYDPLISNRLAFGKAQYKSTTMDILAIAAGSTGDEVRLLRVKPARHGWEQNPHMRSVVPELTLKEEAWWHGNGTPIQQIHCTGDVGESALMAVRLLNSTVVLSPRFDEVVAGTSVVGGVPSHIKVAPLRLHANPVLCISTSQTGGVPHADVDFNPWRQCQVAIVDQQGTWSVSDIIVEKEQDGADHSITSIAKGHINDGGGSDTLYEHTGDGWGAVCFAGSINTLVVCSRRQMRVFDTYLKSTRLTVPSLDLPRTSDWILDLKRNPANHNQIFVLTSSRIFWLSVTGGRRGHDTNEPQIGATTILAWCHYRDENDTSLQLDIFECDEGTFWCCQQLGLVH